MVLRVRCYLPESQHADTTKMKMKTQMKVVEALNDYSNIHSEAFQIKMVTVRGKLLSDSLKE